MARPTRNIGNENVDNEIIDLSGSELMERPEDTVETQLVEVERNGAEDLIEAIDGDQLDNDVDRLVDHAENIEASLEDGGMDECAARATEIAVESICNRWNFKRKTVGVENYASGSSRMSATRLGLESIIDAAKQGFQAIIEWVKRRIVAIKDIWRKYVNVGKSIKARAEKLRKRVAKLEGTPDPDEKVDSTKVWQLMFADKINTDKLRALKETDLTSMVEALGRYMCGSLDAAEKKFEVNLNSADAAYLASDKSEVGDDLGTVVKNKMVMALGGNERKFANLIPSGSTGIRMFSSFGCIIMSYLTKGAKQRTVQLIKLKSTDMRDSEVPALTTDVMDNMLDNVIVAGANLEDYIRKFSKVEASFDKLKRSLEKANSKFAKVSEKKSVDTDKLATERRGIKDAKIAFENAQEIDKIYRAIMTNMAIGMMAYIQESFAAYKHNNED